jgi:hypothetical protein
MRKEQHTLRKTAEIATPLMPQKRGRPQKNKVDLSAYL